MQYGFIIPGGDVRTIVEMAAEAEAAGWDGVFYWDGIYIAEVELMYDPWAVLAAMALRTSRVRIGAVLTPLPRRRPWKVARETVTVDQLSDGRLILPVGLGALDDGGFTKVGEPTDRRTRAELLDESLEILTGLWSAKPFSYAGEHYHLEEMTFRPGPVQAPRIPIWVVGVWPSEKSMQRVVRYDGLLPAKKPAEGAPADLTPDDIRAMRDYVLERRRQTTPLDIVWEGQTPGNDPTRAADIVRPWAEAGATWWMEAMWDANNEPERARARLRRGPPRIE